MASFCPLAQFHLAPSLAFLTPGDQILGADSLSGPELLKIT